jgi:hypothetical protein
MMLSLACVSVDSVGHPSVVMWCDCGEVWCYGLSKVGMVEIHLLMWLVMLESAKDRILGVDTQGQ